VHTLQARGRCGRGVLRGVSQAGILLLQRAWGWGWRHGAHWGQAVRGSGEGAPFKRSAGEEGWWLKEEWMGVGAGEGAAGRGRHRPCALHASSTGPLQRGSSAGAHAPSQQPRGAAAGASPSGAAAAAAATQQLQVLLLQQLLLQLAASSHASRPPHVSPPRSPPLPPPHRVRAAASAHASQRAAARAAPAAPRRGFEKSMPAAAARSEIASSA
jgi:hypothetical protein